MNTRELAARVTLNSAPVRDLPGMLQGTLSALSSSLADWSRSRRR